MAEYKTPARIHSVTSHQGDSVMILMFKCLEFGKYAKIVRTLERVVFKRIQFNGSDCLIFAAW
jgi:hypothetical protein